MRRCVVVLLALALGSASAQTTPPINWYKGNLHTHTANSDGDSPPNEVVAWYKRNAYQFLAISDHDTLTDPGPLDTDPSDNFLLISAEEIGPYPLVGGVHVNAIGVNTIVPSPPRSTVPRILQSNIDAIRAQGAIPIVNHPNFRWAVTTEDLLALKGRFLLEIASGLAASNHAGDGRTPSTEQMWDQLLSAGMRVFAVAVDDAHHFRQDFSSDRANPGRAWVVVHASSLTRANILAALDSGDFYASTGVSLKNIERTRNSLAVEMRTEAPGQSSLQYRFRVFFIGREGRTLAISNENPARYMFVGDEGYVRARIEDSGGRRAWTQPVFVATNR